MVNNSPGWIGARNLTNGMPISREPLRHSTKAAVTSSRTTTPGAIGAFGMIGGNSARGFESHLFRRPEIAPKLLLNETKIRKGFVKKILVLLAIAGACCAYWFLHRPITYEPGVLIGADPTQVNLPRDEPTFDFGDFHLKPLARFTLDARLLHSRIY
jgi:hypothetical protein